jgi:hypothetical protein
MSNFAGWEQADLGSPNLSIPDVGPTSTWPLKSAFLEMLCKLCLVEVPSTR